MTELHHHAQGAPMQARPDASHFAIAEVMAGDDNGLLWLSLGFASAHDPLDVLHIACGAAPTGDAEADALYLERTDQDLACSGEVLQLHAAGDHLALHLTPAGAAALRLGEHTRFDFATQPGLYAQAVAQLARMANGGQACVVLPPASPGDIPSAPTGS